MAEHWRLQDEERIGDPPDDAEVVTDLDDEDDEFDEDDDVEEEEADEGVE